VREPAGFKIEPKPVIGDGNIRTCSPVRPRATSRTNPRATAAGRCRGREKLQAPAEDFTPAGEPFDAKRIVARGSPGLRTIHSWSVPCFLSGEPECGGR
jgi:hypothetical protein